MIILVADDERLIRFMMKSMLSEILTSDDIILEAVNGKEMVKICKEKMPDIVFTDIKMPYLNGIDAIEECRKYSEDTKFVVISGYSEFKYAQRAVKMNVFDYLLKPVEEEQLRQVMEKLQGQIVGNKKELNSRFQLKLLNTFNYLSTLGADDEYEEESYGKDFKYEVIGMKSRCPKNEQEFHIKFQKAMIQKMNTLGKEMIKNGSFYSEIYSSECIPYFVFCTNEDGKEEILSYVKKLSLTSRNEEVAYSFIYFSKETMQDIYYECEKIDQWQGIELNFPLGEVIHMKDVLVSDIQKDLLQYVFRLLGAWERVDAVEYKEVLNNMYRKYKDVETHIELKNVSKYCSMVMQQDIACESFKDFCRSFVDISESMYGNVESGESDVIDKVKAYVDQYYMNDIGVGLIAEVFHITPNYLSAIFHQKAGSRFMDYLIEVRIAHAKKFLIQNKTASVKDIAVMVGYNSPRYFATLFQKTTGMKPSAYRKENTAL